MWFTKRECRSAGSSGGSFSSRYETLYRHTSGSERRSFGDVFTGETANAITMFVGCSDAGVT